MPTSASPGAVPQAPFFQASFFIDNLGCSKNQVDAEVMLAALERAGWRNAGNADDADIIIVNSCGFIDSAKEESISVALEYQQAYPVTPVIMAGCLAQRYPQELFNDMEELAGVFGNRSPQRIVEVATRVRSGERTLLVPQERETPPPRGTLLSFPGSAYVKISEGCDARCTFCAIPAIRGGLQSRTIEEIVAEVERLLARGIHEITLVSQDFSAFGRERASGDRIARAARAGGRGPRQQGSEAAALMRAISALRGDFWIRPLYVYPEQFPREILEICASDARILPYFDLPFQHANRDLLRAMGRPGSGADYLALVREIRDALPHAVLRATLMVGFPGEGEAEFAELQRFVEDAQLDWAGFFVFSPQEGTAAARLAERQPPPPSDVGEARKHALADAQQRISEQRLRRYLGSELPLLLEEPVVGESLYLARAWCHAPDVDGLVVLRTGDLRKPSLRPGMILRGKIVRVNGLDLEAVPVDGAAAADSVAGDDPDSSGADHAG